MKFKDNQGNDFVLHQSQSIAMVSDDDNVKWQIDESGLFILSMKDQVVVEARVSFEVENDKWLPLPYRPVRIGDILYKKTHREQEWICADDSVAKKDQVILDRDYGWEMGMAIGGKINDCRFDIKQTVFTSLHSPTKFFVWSNRPVKVELKTTTDCQTIYGTDDEKLKFKMIML